MVNKQEKSQGKTSYKAHRRTIMVLGIIILMSILCLNLVSASKITKSNFNTDKKCGCWIESPFSDNCFIKDLICNPTKIKTKEKDNFKEYNYNGFEIVDYQIDSESVDDIDLEFESTFIELNEQEVKQEIYINEYNERGLKDVSIVMRIDYDKIRWGGDEYYLTEEPIRLGTIYDEVTDRNIAPNIFFDDVFNKRISYKDVANQGGYALAYKKGNEYFIELVSPDMNLRDNGFVDPTYTNQTDGFLMSNIADTDQTSLFSNGTNFYLLGSGTNFISITDLDGNNQSGGFSTTLCSDKPAQSITGNVTDIYTSHQQAVNDKYICHFKPDGTNVSDGWDFEDVVGEGQLSASYLTLKDNQLYISGSYGGGLTIVANVSTSGTNGTDRFVLDATLSNPTGIINNGSSFFVNDITDLFIYLLAGDGTNVTEGGFKYDTEMGTTRGIATRKLYTAYASENDIYIADATDNFIYHFNSTIVSTVPEIQIVFPSNNTNSSNTGLNVNYTARDDTGLFNCWYSNDSMELNISLATCGTNITTVTWAEGPHNVTVWANNTFGNKAFSKISFAINTTYKLVNITYPYELVNYQKINSNITINWSISDLITPDTCIGSFDNGKNNISLTCLDLNYTVNITSSNNNTFIIWGNDTAGDRDISSRTWNYLLFEDSSGFTTSVLETSQTSVSLILNTTTGFSVNSGILVYNGTSYTSTKEEITSNEFNLSRTFVIPGGKAGFSSEEREFYWNVSLVNITSGTTTYIATSKNNQTVTELLFGLCNSLLNESILNFTLVDEVTGIEINGTLNATTFQATFNLGISSADLLKNYSISNQTVNASKFNFCTVNYTNPIIADMQSFYTAVGYSDKQYYLSNASLIINESNINLYLLKDDDSLEFFINVEQNLDDVVGATVIVAKYFVGEGVYKTVEIDLTDNDGEFTSYLDLDSNYKFTIIKDGIILGVVDKRASCDAAPCNILLSLSSTGANPFSNFDTAFASSVLYNLSYNPKNKTVSFDFVDTSGLATYFRMAVYNSKTNQSSIMLYNNTLYTSSGRMVFNVSGYDGDFLAQTYISRSPEKLIDFITFIINDAAEVLGLTGLFVALLLMLTVIFGLSLKPSMLVMAVPLSLTIFKLIGFISLSQTSIVLVYVLAFVALFALSK